MKKHAIMTRPKHDVVCAYLHAFSADLDCRFHVTDLEGEKAVRSQVEKHLCLGPTLVLLQGHGNERVIAGHKDEIILDEKNAHLTREMIVYALACNSLRVLGRSCVKKGARAFIGYHEEFMLVRDPTWETSPLKDKNARYFKDVLQVTMIGLLQGRCVGEVVERTRQEYMRQIRSVGTSEDDPYGDAPLVRLALAWDLEFLGMVGDANAAF